MNAPVAQPTADLVPLSLRDAPALIESAFPAQKVSFEAQTERKAVQSQTLTGLGSYWKGRKPLILVRAIVLGSLMPKTDDPEKDLEIFEALMGFDLEGLARRALEAGEIKPKDIASRIILSDPWEHFTYSIKASSGTPGDFNYLGFPLNADELGIQIKWRRETTAEQKVPYFKAYLETVLTYEERALLCKRPEEVDQHFLLAPVWPRVNEHLGRFGVSATSMDQLVHQLGVLRFGRRPVVGDTFAGGGSIPFEAARMGCDVYASDLNPVACMLNWANLNVIGAQGVERIDIVSAQLELAKDIEEAIVSLGIEHDSRGNRAKAYLYCIEALCPESGWRVPLIPTLVISKSRNVVAKLVPNHDEKRFEIEVHSGVSAAEMGAAEKGTVGDGSMTYELDGRTYSVPIRTLRGDYRTVDGESGNRLRRWAKTDFTPHTDDIFRERLYAIQWMTKESLSKGRQETYFAAVTSEDLERERRVEEYLRANIQTWQEEGYIPDMEIESGFETTRLRRERGWTHWHHLFAPRQLLFCGLVGKKSRTSPVAKVFLGRMLDWNSKLCRYGTGAARESIAQTFYNQAFNTFFNYGVRSFGFSANYLKEIPAPAPVHCETYRVVNAPAADLDQSAEYWITDPPYADAVNYHEITEFFIAWLRKNPPVEFADWIWDSRRALAIKGDGDDFRRGMIDAYTAMARNMPNNGMQCVMFTHQDTGVWSDMVGIFWAAGLQVVAAWYIATETSTELKKGGYVQGTVTLMLRKRQEGDRPGFKQRILPSVRAEVKAQIEQMLHLNEEARHRMGEPIFNDADLQMAGYAAALKVLTSYTKIGDTDVTSFALRPRVRGEVTVVDEIVQEASEAANSLLVPEGLSQDTWQALGGVQRFYLRMLDMESAGVFKLDNYQNFAKAFRVEDYTRVMASMAANSACLKQPNEFTSRDLTDSTEIGPTWLGAVIVGIQQVLKEVELKVVVQQLMEDIPEFLDVRPKLIDVARFLAAKTRDGVVRSASEVLADRMQNQRALGQD